MENNTFSTTDITLASFLTVKEIPLVEVTAVSNFICKFTFEQPPRELLDAWLAGDALVDIRQAVNGYRHLLREARMQQGGR